MNPVKQDAIDTRRLKILVSDRTDDAEYRARGKLFETIIRHVLSNEGYRVDHVYHRDAVPIELDIEGKHVENGCPFYAACRFSEAPATEHDLQAFYGRYMIKWHMDRRCHGLFIVLPGLDGEAGKFYREHIGNNEYVATFLYEESDILKAISKMPGLVGPDQLADRIPSDNSETSQSILLYTESGMFWILPIFQYGKKTPDKMALFDVKGAPISDRSVIASLVKRYPVLADFDFIPIDKTVPLQAGLFPDTDPVVEVNGSATCFEYQYPASPKHFVGRKSFFDILDTLTSQVLQRRTTDRGIVFEAPAGWGKSSMVLASAAHVRKKGHLAVTVDCFTASSSTFVPRVIEHVASKPGDINARDLQPDQKKSTPTFDDALRWIIDIGRDLESRDKLIFIFFDQFEYIFFLPDVLRQIKDLFLKLVQRQTNIIIGFSYNRELVVSSPLFSDHPFDAVAEKCRQVLLPTFSTAEIDALLKKLVKELDEPLTKALRSFLHIFSQGYPWLLKLLCFHVKIARHSGIPQTAIPGILLGIEELFRQEFQHLSDAERATLHKIAEPVSGRLSASFKTVDPQVIQSLVRRGLIKRVGTCLDVSWNILRYYLDAGTLPFRDFYLFHAAIEHVVDALKILYDADGILDVSGFKNRIGMSDHAFYGLAKDMDLVGLVSFSQGKVFLKLDMPHSDQDLVVVLRNSLRSRLSANHMVSEILKALKDNHALTMVGISMLLERLSPSVRMKKRVWLTRAQVLGQWMDAADLALLDKKTKKLAYLDPASEIRERDLFLPRRRGGKIPRVQYAPIENIAVRLVQALHGDGIVDWTGFSKHTIFGALAVLEDLGFIQRKTPLIKVLPRAKAFAVHPDQRPFLFAEGAMQLTSFSVFIEILKSKRTTESTLLELGHELRKRLGAGWKENTSETIAKIMLDWARHANLAPGVFAKTRKGPIKGRKKKKDTQLSLF